MSDLFLKALSCDNHSRPPVWIMRQAGRYMPAYRAIRNKYSFLEMIHTPDLVAEVTLLPVQTFGMDAAILFSDILVVAEAFGLGLHFKDSLGPIIERPIQTTNQINALSYIEIKDSFLDIAQAIKLVRPQLKVPLIGFCGGPFTVASYMIEGGTSRDLLKTKQWMLRDPVSFHQLLNQITRCSVDYLKLQIEAGVQAIQVFDSWANTLGYHQFKEFCFDYLNQIVQKLRETNTPIILYCRGSSVFAKDLATIEPQALSIDWNGDLSHIRTYVSPQIALQGNLDPDILYAPLATVKQETERLLQSMRGDPGYIFNLGHGVKPDVSPDAVKILVDTVKSF